MTEETLQTYRWGQEIPLIERVIFGRRGLWLALFAVVTLVLGWQATKLQPDASFEKMIPQEHPYIQGMMRHIADLGAAGTTIQVVVENTRGDIFDARYLDVVQKVTDELFYLPGIDRNRMRSLWTPNVRWTEVTEEGFEGDKVIDANYDGSPEAMEQLRANILRSGELGRLVADDFRSTIVEAPLFDRDPKSGEPLDYATFSQQLEADIRAKYQTDGIRIRIVGFAKMVGDLLEGIKSIVLFAAVTLLVTAVLLYLYSRTAKATAIALMCSLIAVIWQLGLLHVLGYGLNAYSILVPFLVFAIGVSHGVQIVNGIAVTSGDDVDSMRASRLAFRNLYIPGTTALVSDAAGFITMWLIPIQVIRDLGVAASVGVAVVILTNLMLLPLVMSFVRLDSRSVARMRAGPEQRKPYWELLSKCATPSGARGIVAVAIVLALGGTYLSQDIQIGDLDAGAPELRPDSRYNLDSAYINEHYGTSSDVLVIMVETAPEKCSKHANMALIDQFMWQLQNVPGVESTMGAPTVSRLVLSGYNEGSLKWATVSRDQRALNSTFGQVPEQLMNTNCSLLPVIAFLADHRADTLERVLGMVESFAEKHNSDAIRFVPAAGSAGIEAATNQEIRNSRLKMLYLVYSVVAALVFLSFGSIRAVVCIILPLALTSVLCQALMATVGIGVKVATLPVIALGVGVGVDYGIYVYARLTAFLKQGMPLHEAYRSTLYSTGKAVAFTGVTLAIGVATWIFSPIKFQADMGMLLTFLFLFNMVGALTLLPALACLLPEKKAVSA